MHSVISGPLGLQTLAGEGISKEKSLGAPRSPKGPLLPPWQATGGHGTKGLNRSEVLAAEDIRHGWRNLWAAGTSDLGQ